MDGMEEIKIKEEVLTDETKCADNIDQNALMCGVTIKEEPDDLSSLDGMPFEEITIKPEKIEPYGASDDNNTDIDCGLTAKSPKQEPSNEDSKKERKQSPNVCSVSPNTAAVSPRSSTAEKGAASSNSALGNSGDNAQHGLNSSLAAASNLSESSNTGQVCLGIDEPTPGDFLCNVVADLNVPPLHDYIMMPLDMDQSGSSSSKARCADPNRWVSVAAKKARNLGEEYVSPDGSVVVKARKMGPGCGFSCRYKCHDKLSEVHRQGIFSHFWKMGTHSLHWDFISRHVKVMKKKTSTSPNDSRRQTSRIYYFRVNGEEVQVCKTMFTHTLGVWDQWIETAIRKSQASDGSEFPDMRGKHTTNASRTYGASPVTKASVINHIKMFKPVVGRDIGRKSEKQFLEEGLSVSSMHKLYIEWMSNQEGKPASLRQYRDLFNSRFDISFFVPRKECTDCTVYNSASPEERLHLEQDYQEHVKRKTLMKELKLADAQEAKSRGNTHIGMACFDLQKVLSTPQCRSSLLHYKHKLSVFNLTLCDVGTHAGYCFVWHEGIGKRTSNEIASFLLHYIEMKCNVGATEFRLYCDDGYGLNKDKAVMCACTYAAAKFGVKIRLRYLLRGHSHNETDNMQNLIEKRGKDYLMYVPDDWVKVMESAKNWKNPQGEASNPYTVIEVTQEMIFDFTELVGKLNFDVDVNGGEVPWSRVCEVSFDNSEPVCFEFNCELDGAPSKVCTALAGQSVDFKFVSLKKAYDGPLPVSQTKLDDLLSLCNGTIVPSRYHQFYRGLKGSLEVEEPECVRQIEPRRAANSSDCTEENSSDSEEPPSKKAK